MEQAKFLTHEPIVAVVASMHLHEEGLAKIEEWVAQRYPECFVDSVGNHWSLLPHQDGVTDNELLVEIAGRKCYNSFGSKAGKKSNREYIANTQQGEIPHASIMYHAKMTFFIAGISRRVSHELIRHYVGADRDEEGSPSQESTRYVEHPGYYVVHPGILDNPSEVEQFKLAMKHNYGEYRDYIARRIDTYTRNYGNPPTGMDRKRIFESSSSYLSHSCETSFIWTTNPVAVAKLFHERDNEAADLEFLRLAKVWKDVCVKRWPNLFPQLWMQDSYMKIWGTSLNG